LKTTYKTYTIVTEPTKHADAGWTGRASVYDTNGALVMEPLDLGQDVIFATSELADHAALLLGRAWVDRLEP
jgi:hypothetical protein